MPRIGDTSFLARLFSGGAWALTGRILSALAALLIAALLARLLSPEAVGTYFLLANTVTICASTALLGANQVVVRLIASSTGGKNSIAESATINSGVLLAAIGLLAAAAVFVFELGPRLGEDVFRSPAFVNATTISAAWIFVSGAQLFQADFFRGFHLIREATIFGGLLSACALASILSLLWATSGAADPRTIVEAATISALLSVAIGFAYLRSKVVGWKMPDVQSLSRFGHLAWPVGITSVGLLFLSHADLLILGVHAKADQVSIYGMSARLAGFLALPLLIANSVVPPLIAEYHSKGLTNELAHGLRSAATLATGCSVALYLLLVIFGKELLSLVYGPYFEAGYPILLVLGIGQLVNVWAGSCGMTLIMTGNQKAMMSISIFSAAFVVCGAWVFASRFGATGVAAIQSLALALQNALMLVTVKKRCGFWTYAALGIPRG